MATPSRTAVHQPGASVSTPLALPDPLVRIAGALGVRGLWVAASLLAAVVAMPIVFVPGASDVWVLPKLAVLAAAVIVGTVATLVPNARSRARTEPGGAIETAVVAYVVLSAAATATSINPGLSIEGEPWQHQGLATTLLYAAAFFLARAVLADPAAQRALGRLVLVTGAAIAAYAVAQAAGADPVWAALPKGRPVATIGQANALAAYLVMAFWLGLGALPGRTVLRFVAMGGLALIAVAIALTLSRGGYVGFAVAFGVAVSAALRGPDGARRRPIPDVRLLVVGIGAATLILAAGSLRDEPARVLARVGQVADASEGSARIHIALWSVGARIALDFPLLGTGPDTYAEVFPAYRNVALPSDVARQLADFRPESPHNVPIAIAAGAGVPALIAYLAIVLLVLRQLLSVRESGDGRRPAFAIALLAVIAGHFVTDLFMTAEVTGSALFWIALGTGSAMADGREGFSGQVKG